MPPSIPLTYGVLVLVGGLAAAPLAAQGSPYIPLDDPRLPLLEHLIGRGDIEDPSPMIRPFRRADAVRVLAAADTGSGTVTSNLVHTLRTEFEPLDAPNSWEVGGRAGGQGYTHARRDPLHPAGTGRVRPLVEGRGQAIIGRFVLVTRPVGEPRLIDDPDWPGRKAVSFVGRMAEAYISAQFGWGSLFYGQMDRNWGPVGMPGIGLSDYAYGRDAAGLDIGTRDLRLYALASGLRDEKNDSGQVIHRYFFAHRLGVRVSDRLRLAIWETSVLAGFDRNFDARFRNPVSLLLLANQYGLEEEGSNVLVGLDGHWRAFRRTTFQLQLGIDDIQYQNRSGPGRYPDRWAVTLAGFGPLGRELAWRALYTRATSLTFRTQDPFENLTDSGVGLGRNFADMDELTASVSFPLARRWLISPDLTLLRQGEGQINDPFPATALEAGQIPQIFIGVVERTYRIGLTIRGRQGPLDLEADAGLHHIVNWKHEEGRTVDRFEGRLQATLGLSRRGVLR